VGFDRQQSPVAIDVLLVDLKSDFALKDLGPLHYFLGIEVKQLAYGILLSQEKYATDLLNRFDMISCKPVTTPLSTSKKLSARGGGVSPDEATKYRGAIGALYYLSHTRLDLSFCINKVC
jgi:hypothetical protein